MSRYSLSVVGSRVVRLIDENVFNSECLSALWIPEPNLTTGNESFRGKGLYGVFTWWVADTLNT